MYVIYVCCRQIAPPQGAAPDRLLHASAAFGPATVVPVPPGNGESICACTKPHIYIYIYMLYHNPMEYIGISYNIVCNYIYNSAILYIYIYMYYTSVIIHTYIDIYIYIIAFYNVL